MLSAIVSHSGKQHAYWHARAMERLGCLHRFITSSYYAPQRWPDRLLSRWAAADRYLRRRCLDGLDARVIRQPLFELPEIMCRAAIGNGRLVRDLILQRDALFDRWVASTLSARGGADSFWGFQGSCCQSLAAARRVGLTAVVELATGHAPAAEAILGRERQRHPEWADSLSNDAFPRWYGRRLDDEVIRADYCVVASTFTRQTLERSGVEDARILTLPLGADLRRFTFSRRSSTGPFQILFVGGVGQRKGIKYLLDAYDRIRGHGIRLVVVGPLVGSGRAFRARMRGVEYVGRADQAAVVDHMRNSHVLVLPSLFEGFGLVIPEAMATGMPVIASTHSAAPDILREGRDGFVLAPDDVDGLAEALTRLATHRQDAVAMGAEAAMRATEFGWDRHTERLADVCRTIEAKRNDSIVRAATWAGGLN